MHLVFTFLYTISSIMCKSAFSLNSVNFRCFYMFYSSNNIEGKITEY